MEEKKSFKESLTEAMSKGKDFVIDKVHYVKDHSDKIVPVAITALELLGVGAAVAYNVGKADELNKTVYDEVTGEYVITNKKLTNADKVQLASDMNDGMTKTQALFARGKLNMKK